MGRYTKKTILSRGPPMIPNAFLAQHRTWTVSRWVLPLLEAPAQTIADTSVMTLGLVGEVAEVADVVESWASSGICDTPNLVKELGDAFFYWSRVSASFDLPLPTPTAIVQESMCAGCPAAKPPVLEVLRMVRAAGKASEAVKKYLRDGSLDKSKLEQGLSELYVAWLEVCSAAGLSPLEVIQKNSEKVEGRVVRGTQRGSGDHR